jgi:hypothetical protein
MVGSTGANKRSDPQHSRIIINFYDSNVCSAPPVDSFFSLGTPQVMPTNAAQLEADTDQLTQQLQFTEQQLESTQQQMLFTEQQLEYSQQQLQATLEELRQLKEGQQDYITSVELEQQLVELKNLHLAEKTAVELNQEQLKQQLAEHRQLAETTAANMEQLRQQLDAKVAELTGKEEQLTELRQQQVWVRQQLAASGAAEQAAPVAEPPATAAHLFATAESSSPQAVADLFAPVSGGGAVVDDDKLFSAVSTTSTLFSDAGPSTASLFGATESTTTAAGDAFFTGPVLSTVDNHQAEAANTTAAPQVPSPQSLEEYQAWYQQELESYQAAILQWQAWGEERAAEVAALQDNLAAVSGSLAVANQEIESWRATSEESAPANSGGHHDRVNEMLKLMRIKDLELEELRETIDR